MNKTIKFKHLLYALGVLLFILAVGYTFNSIADESFWIGSVRLWDDVDSNYLKVSRKISRTAGASLFDFNTSQFSWIPGTGLTISNPLGDSLHGRVLNIYRDTTISETDYFKGWVLKRPYITYYDSLSLIWQYYNTLSAGSNPRRDIWVINKLVYAYKDDLNVESSSGEGIPITFLSLPHGGLWKIEAVCNFYFKPYGGGVGNDSVDFEIVDPASKYIDTVRTWHAFDVNTGYGGTVTLMGYYYGAAGLVSFNAQSFMNSGATILLKKGRLFATLIN